MCFRFSILLINQVFAKPLLFVGIGLEHGSRQEVLLIESPWSLITFTTLPPSRPATSIAPTTLQYNIASLNEVYEIEAVPSNAITFFRLPLEIPAWAIALVEILINWLTEFLYNNDLK